MAAQLMATNGLVRRGLRGGAGHAPGAPCPCRCPRECSAVALVGATFSMARHSAAHGVAHADDALKRHGAGLLAQAPVLLFELADAKRAPHDDREHACIDRLVIEIRRSEPHRLHRQLARIRLGHRDDFGVRARESGSARSSSSSARPRPARARDPGRTARRPAPCAAPGSAPARARSRTDDVKVGETSTQALARSALVALQSRSLRRSCSDIERVHQRAPLPMNTTSTVCSRIDRSNSRLLFLM